MSYRHACSQFEVKFIIPRNYMVIGLTGSPS